MTIQRTSTLFSALEFRLPTVMRVSLPATASPLVTSGISNVHNIQRSSRTLVCLEYYLPGLLVTHARPVVLAPRKPKIVCRLFKASRNIHNISLNPDMLRKN